ncbi:hypothetical protein CY34DRAFT_156800 [Suillus luteus UH-Slu-Lm8-n1]|uniref:Uncharacterized protein n=1 Tax=Suillus luteus UH-Slu-Lm8-n1 TaxID=930992 RepID=A0A0D0B6Z5_9AGAM|nr:hypothetical protein CY34DRAFT_156800 [Suillus luteus UH-Slu-Lm8-n1]
MEPISSSYAWSFIWCVRLLVIRMLSLLFLSFLLSSLPLPDGPVAVSPTFVVASYEMYYRVRHMHLLYWILYMY